jgi:hypothetical protein
MVHPFLAQLTDSLSVTLTSTGTVTVPPALFLSTIIFFARAKLSGIALAIPWLPRYRSLFSLY